MARSNPSPEISSSLLHIAQEVPLADALPFIGISDERRLQVDAEGLGAAVCKHPAEASLATPEVDHLQPCDVTDDLQHAMVEETLTGVVTVLLRARDPFRGEGGPFRLQIGHFNHAPNGRPTRPAPE
jgi:hypothetical protein